MGHANGYKVPILLEELGAPYELIAVNISAGEQKTSEYLALNPNGKIPVLADTEANISIFESGAILMYLAEKHKQFLPADVAGKYAAIEWLMFQMAGVGPMFGQANYFVKFAKEKIPHAIERYTAEAARLSGVMERRLAHAPYLAGEYGIADMAIWPWVRSGVSRGYVDLENYPNLKRWFKAIEERPAVGRALGKVDAAAEAKEKE